MITPTTSAFPASQLNSGGTKKSLYRLLLQLFIFPSESFSKPKSSYLLLHTVEKASLLDLDTRLYLYQ